MGQSLSHLLLNKVVALTFGLVKGNCDVLVEFVLLAFHHLAHSLSHLGHEEDVQLGVEAILVVLVKTLDRAFLAEVFFDDADNCLLHALLKDVILARLVELVQEFFFALLVLIVLLLGTDCRRLLFLEVLLEHLIVLASECFDGDDTLFAEVVGGCLGEGPFYEGLGGNDLLGAWLSD